MTRDDRLQLQVNKSKLIIRTLTAAYQRGDINLKELVDGENRLGQQYSRWAESEDNQANRVWYRRERPVGLKGVDY